MKRNKSMYTTVSVWFISTDGLTAVGVRDTYENGRYLYSKVSTNKDPRWNTSRLSKLRIPLVPFFGSMSMFEMVGEL